MLNHNKIKFKNIRNTVYSKKKKKKKAWDSKTRDYNIGGVQEGNQWDDGEGNLRMTAGSKA